MGSCEHLNKTLIASVVAAGLGPVGAMAATPATAQVGPLMDFASYSFIEAGVSPVIARSSGGNFVLAWQPHVASSGDYGPAQVQPFAADGTPLSAPISIGSRVSGNVAVAMDRDGDFVVGWTDGLSAGYGGLEELYVQRYSANGTSQGLRKWLGDVYNGISGVAVKTFFYKGASPLQVAMDDDGDFVAAWSEYKETEIIENFYNIFDSSSSKTYAVAYAASGSLLKAKTLVDQVRPSGYSDVGLPNADLLASITMNAKGDLALVYNSYRKGSVKPPVARFYDIDLSPLGSAMNLSAVTTGNNINASTIGIDATDTLLIGWNQTDGTRWARYTADGSQVGTVAGPFGNYGYPCQSTLSVAASGAAVLTWGVEIQADPSGSGTSTTSCEVHGQHFAANDTALDTAFVIDAGTAQINQPGAPYAAAVDGNGNLVLAWLATLSNLTPEIVGRTVTTP